MAVKQLIPPARRSFADSWDELGYLCRKVRFWLYERADRGRAQRFGLRLEAVLRRIPQNEVALLRREGLALASELRGDLRGAIRHREEEIRLMKRLHEIAASARVSESTREYMLQGRKADDLRARLTLLESLKSNLADRNGH